MYSCSKHGTAPCSRDSALNTSLAIDAFGKMSSLQRAGDCESMGIRKASTDMGTEMVRMVKLH